MVDPAFALFMSPDIHWIRPGAFDQEFNKLLEEDMGQAGFTKPGSSYPGYINVRFEGGKALVTLRGAAVHNPGNRDVPEHDAEGPTVTIEMDIADWDQWAASAQMERSRSQRERVEIGGEDVGVLPAGFADDVVGDAPEHHQV